MKLRPTALLVTSAALLGLAPPTPAATTNRVDLTNAQEVLPSVPGGVMPTTSTGTPRPASSGTATLMLNDALTALTYVISVFNIDFTGSQTLDTNDNLTNAHFHAGSAAAPTQLVVFGFIGTPFNETMPNDVVVTPFVNGVGGTVSGKWDAPEGNNTTLTAQLPNILAGRAYLNFHTVQFSGGEIRGNIAAVPEPATWTAMLIGFGVVGGAMRLRRRKFATAVRA